MAFSDLQSSQLGAGIGIARLLLQPLLHRLTQSAGLVAALKQLGPVTVVDQGRLAAVDDAPLGFVLEQRLHAVVNHRVVGPAPANPGMASEQATDPGIGSHGRATLVAQQVDHQHIRLGHQGAQGGDGLLPQLFIGIEHQHPVAAHMAERCVPGRSEVSRPGDAFHPGAGRFGHGDGVVTRAGVHHHHLVGQASDRAEACLQPLRLVAHDHRETEHRIGPDLLGGYGRRSLSR